MVGILMNIQKLVSKRGLAVVAAAAALLLLTPMFVADADSTLAPAHARYVEYLMSTHDARYMLNNFGRVPLPCAAEMHGA